MPFFSEALQVRAVSILNFLRYCSLLQTTFAHQKQTCDLSLGALCLLPRAAAHACEDNTVFLKGPCQVVTQVHFNSDLEKQFFNRRVLSHK